MLNYFFWWMVAAPAKVYAAFVFLSIFTMNFVLAHIQYNPECFSKIIDDFDEYVKCAEQENFQEHFDDLENLAKIRGEEDDIIILKKIILLS